MLIEKTAFRLLLTVAYGHVPDPTNSLPNSLSQFSNDSLFKMNPFEINYVLHLLSQNTKIGFTTQIVKTIAVKIGIVAIGSNA